jgi:phosphoribosylanthranilate isomerase
MNTLIKICGITSKSDARAALEAGAHALGFNFYAPSPRFVGFEYAREIIGNLPPFVTTVAVLVNESVADVRKLLNIVPVDILQLHGDETPGLCESYGYPYIKAIRTRTIADAAVAAEKYPGARGVLLDTLVSDKYGGTGESFDWQRLPDSLYKPVILAGGLDPENVAYAIRTVRPYAVDVISGVEFTKGRKDADKIKRFVEAVRSVDI